MPGDVVTIRWHLVPFSLRCCCCCCHFRPTSLFTVCKARFFPSAHFIFTIFYSLCSDNNKRVSSFNILCFFQDDALVIRWVRQGISNLKKVAGVLCLCACILSFVILINIWTGWLIPKQRSTQKWPNWVKIKLNSIYMFFHFGGYGKTAQATCQQQSELLTISPAHSPSSFWLNYLLIKCCSIILLFAGRKFSSCACELKILLIKWGFLERSRIDKAWCTQTFHFAFRCSNYRRIKVACVHTIFLSCLFTRRVKNIHSWLANSTWREIVKN